MTARAKTNCLNLKPSLQITVGEYIGKYVFRYVPVASRVVILTLESRSFIAAYLGNIIGALLVGIPPLYFYLRDTDHINILNEAERGHAMRTRQRMPGQSLGDASSDNMTENGVAKR